MSVSPKLGLKLTAQTDNPTFKDWRTRLDGDSEDSNMMLIDTIVGEHLTNISNPHGVTAAQIGAETPDGAQAKADTARELAFEYADWKIAAIPVPAVSGQIAAHDADSSAHSARFAGKADKHLTRTASLTVAGWATLSQSVTVSGVTAANTVFVAPAPASQEAYAKAGVRCTAQAANKLTFVCKEVPTAALAVNVVILGV